MSHVQNLYLLISPVPFSNKTKCRVKFTVVPLKVQVPAEDLNRGPKSISYVDPKSDSEKHVRKCPKIRAMLSVTPSKVLVDLYRIYICSVSPILKIFDSRRPPLRIRSRRAVFKVKGGWGSRTHATNLCLFHSN